MGDGPSIFSQVFNERGAVLAFFGALGGAVRSATLKTTWKEGLRVIFIGGAFSFGVGALGPYVISPWVGTLPQDLSAALGTLCSAAFFIGLIGVTVAERFVFGHRQAIHDATD